MNKDQKKKDINFNRFEFLRKIAKLSQEEVDRCYELIDNASTQEELDKVVFTPPDNNNI